MEEFTKEASRSLERVIHLCGQLGLKHIELAPAAFGVGIAVGFGPTEYVVLSVMAGGSEDQLMITSGILTEIKLERLPALEAANHLTFQNTAFPVYLHDADAGWALVTQQTQPLQLLIDLPAYFDTVVRSVVRSVNDSRVIVAEKWDLGGRPWEWNASDLQSLLNRSMV